MRIMIAGGGTGGHVYPGIAIYRALTKMQQHVDVLFVGAKSGVEEHIFAELQLPNVRLSGRGVRGASLTSKVLSPFIFLGSILRGIREILRFKPDVVVGTGGFASVAIVAASVICGRKRVLQEQNSVPGMANRMLSRFADLVLLSYESSRQFLGPQVPCSVVGNPLRMDATPDRAAALKFFDLRNDLPTVLFFGGSRGARSINDTAINTIKRILGHQEVQFVMLTGEADHERVSGELATFGTLVRVLPFLQEIHHAYSVADIAVSRAGASSVFELAAFGVPTVFVPYPFAADDHQRRNVAELKGLGAAVVVDNSELDGEKLEAIITSLLNDRDQRAEMSAQLRAWVKTDADVVAAQKIKDLVFGAAKLQGDERIADVVSPREC